MKTKSLLLSATADIAVTRRALALAGAARFHSLLMLASAGGEIAEEVKKAVEPLMTAFDAFKEANDARLKEIEKKGSADPVLTDKLAKIETTLSSYEGINQKLATAETQSKALAEQVGAVNAIIAKMEAKLGRPGQFSLNGFDAFGRKTELKKRVGDWARAVIQAGSIGAQNLNDDQRKMIGDISAAYKVLRISDDTLGGYLAVPEFVPEIIEAIVLISNARSIVNVRQTANKSVRIPKRTGVFAAQRVTEQGTRSETTGLTFGLEEVLAPEMYAIIDISNEDLEDSAFDLQEYIQQNAAEQFAVLEGKEFVTGTGVGQLEGVLTNAAIAADVTTNAATLSADGVLNVCYNLKTAYARNASYILNRQTIGAVRTLKDGVGNYLWMPGLQNGLPNSINGQPYYEFPDMPAVGASTYPIAFGDWKRAYTIVDRIAMTFLRDPYTQGASGNVRMWFRRRCGGAVVLAEAIRKLQCHT
jgi:HK97 family phage major capsid protein